MIDLGNVITDLKRMAKHQKALLDTAALSAEKVRQTQDQGLI